MQVSPVDKTQPGYRRALLLIVMFGLISLFSDLVYQAGRSLNGPLLGVLGADAALVGLIAGVAEFLGYGLRLFTGSLVDKTKSYWGFTIAGYAMVAAVPLLMLAGTWQVAALFIVIERGSKAVRAPAKDTLLSMAARRVGTGRGFAIHKVMDQTGAILGPLAMSLFLSGTLGNTFQGLVSYQQAYALLWIPLGLVLLAAFLGQRAVPHPEKLEEELAVDAPHSAAAKPANDSLTRTFWIYSLFTLLVGIGFVNFTLLSFHALKAGLLTDAAIPFWYAMAMAANAVAAYVVGTLYDKWGLKVLYAVPLLSIPLPFLGFLGGTTVLVVVAIVLFGFSLGIQETILKAGVADMVSLAKRGTGYGIFNTLNGLGLLASGVMMGLLYDVSVLALCLVTVAVEVAALAVLWRLLKKPQADV
jgi:hypothetical protein